MKIGKTVDAAPAFSLRAVIHASRGSSRRPSPPACCSFSPLGGQMKLAAVYAGLATVCCAATPPAQPNVITLL